MNTYTLNNQCDIYTRVVKLTEAIMNLSENIPVNDFLQLRIRLRKSANMVSARIEDCLSNDNKLDIIRSIIKINGSIDECCETLQLIHSLKYANTKELINELFELTKLFNEEFRTDSLETIN